MSSLNALSVAHGAVFQTVHAVGDLRVDGVGVVDGCGAQVGVVFGPAARSRFLEVCQRIYLSYSGCSSRSGSMPNVLKAIASVVYAPTVKTRSMS